MKTAPATARIDFSRAWVATAAMLLLLGVILGAFGAHALEPRLTARQFASYQTGVLYHLLHSLGLLGIGLLAGLTGTTATLRWAARLMLAGVVLFSGSIYLMTAGAPRTLGMVAPIGGTSFMVAWLLVAVHALRRDHSAEGST
jgi:uncharacterized membrane protein YgdD (TMEM256/DUF423 family)